MISQKASCHEVVFPSGSMLGDSMVTIAQVRGRGVCYLGLSYLPGITYSSYFMYFTSVRRQKDASTPRRKRLSGADRPAKPLLHGLHEAEKL